MAIILLILLGILVAIVGIAIIGAVIWTLGSFFGWLIAMCGHDDLFKDKI